MALTKFLRAMMVKAAMIASFWTSTLYASEKYPAQNSVQNTPASELPVARDSGRLAWQDIGSLQQAQNNCSNRDVSTLTHIVKRGQGYISILRAHDTHYNLKGDRVLARAAQEFAKLNKDRKGSLDDYIRFEGGKFNNGIYFGGKRTIGPDGIPDGRLQPGDTLQLTAPNPALLPPKEYQTLAAECRVKIGENNDREIMTSNQLSADTIMSARMPLDARAQMPARTPMPASTLTTNERPENSVVSDHSSAPADNYAFPWILYGAVTVLTLGAAAIGSRNSKNDDGTTKKEKVKPDNNTGRGANSHDEESEIKSPAGNTINSRRKIVAFVPVKDFSGNEKPEEKDYEYVLEPRAAKSASAVSNEKANETSEGQYEKVPPELKNQNVINAYSNNDQNIAITRALSLYYGKTEKAENGQRTHSYKYTVEELCQESGVSKYVFYKTIKQQGLSTRRDCARMIKEANRHYIAQAVHTQSIDSLCNELGLKESTVRSYARSSSK